MGKRGNGEGSIWQRKDGVWAAAASMGYNPATGKPIRKFVYAKTRAEVAKKLRALQDDGPAPKPGNALTVAKLMEEYLAHKKGEWRPGTYTTAESVTRNHITKKIGAVKLADLSTHTVAKWIREESGTRVTQQARKHLLAACELAIRWEWLAKNPVTNTEVPTKPRRTMPDLSIEEIAALLKFAQSPRGGYYDMGPLICVMLGTGLRLGEALGLRWEDWGEQGLTLNVRNQVGKVDGEWVATPLKTKASRRSIAVPVFVASALARQKASQGTPGALGLIFADTKGNPMNGPNTSHRISAVLSEAGHPGMTPHHLRHAYASCQIDKGTPITEVAAALGHSSPSITMSVYAHKLKGTGRRVANVMDELFGGVEG